MSIHKIIKGIKLNETEQQILDYLEDNSHHVLDIRIQKVAEDNFTSTSSVFRLSKKLGFSGYKELTYYLANNHHDSAMAAIDEAASLHLANDIHSMINLNKDALQSLKTSLETSPSIAIIANGYSAIIGEYLYKKMLTKGIRCIQLTASDSNKIIDYNLSNLTHIICISRSGETASLLNQLKEIEKNAPHITRIGFTQNSNNSIAVQSHTAFMIVDENKRDWDNLTISQFHPFLLIYIEYMLSSLFD